MTDAQQLKAVVCIASDCNEFYISNDTHCSAFQKMALSLQCGISLVVWQYIFKHHSVQTYINSKEALI